jgi:hypothetical protein
MTYLFTLLGMAGTLGLIFVGVNMRGALGGFIGFIVGVILTGVIAAKLDIDLDRGCTKYSNYADDC